MAGRKDPMAALHSERWEQTSGRPVRVLVCGLPRPGTPPVVLLAGLGSVEYMVELLHACGGWTEASLLDLPGYGRPETADCPADLESLTAALVEALPARPAVLVGHATGAQLALRAALQVPGSVHALALIGPTFEPRARRRRALLARHLRTSMWEPAGQLRNTLPDHLRGGNRRRQYLRSALQDRPEERIRQVQVPVWVGRGRHDQFCPPGWARELADAAPRGRVITLPGAHNVPYTYPGAAASLVGQAATHTSGEDFPDDRTPLG
jgi:pimeloyl-ACP methyl ester carboxylesterase